MSRLRDAEIRRLISYLRQHLGDESSLAGIEDMLRGEEAQEYLREPEILAYFPEVAEDFDVGEMRWRLRVIPHARLRSVQRGISTLSIVGLFRRFVEWSQQQGAIIAVGTYAISGRIPSHKGRVTLRADVDEITQGEATAHIVTIVIGATEAEIDFDLY